MFYMECPGEPAETQAVGERKLKPAQHAEEQPEWGPALALGAPAALNPGQQPDDEEHAGEQPDEQENLAAGVGRGRAEPVLHGPQAVFPGGQRLSQ